MAELTTKTGTDVAYEVKRQFGDEDAVQITDADILKWINSAQRRIVQTNPILQRSVLRDTVGGQQTYTYPPERVQYIQSLFFKGIPLEGLSYTEAMEYISQHGLADKTGEKPLIWWQWAQTIHLWPIPEDSETGVLKMDYIAIPEDLTALSDTLSVPDRYFDSVVEQVMMRAHLLDEDYDAAGFARGSFNESIAALSEQENRQRLSTYPTITLREEDRW